MPINRFFTVLVMLVVLVTPTFTRHPTTARAAVPASPVAVIVWNGIAQRAAITVAKQAGAQSLIAIAFAQAAVYDAVVAIAGGYQPYKLNLTPRPTASVDAAVATAAHDVLIHYFPAQQAALDTDYAYALAAIPDGAAKTDGIAVGQEAAAGIIDLRQGDGLEANIGFTMPAPAPGVWQLPAGVAPQTPWVSKLRPFMLERPDQFRPGPPPDLTSQEWAAEYNEVKTIGRSDSPYRTAEQTDVARFWSTNPIPQYNTAFKQFTLDRGLNAVQAARLFAIGNLVGAGCLTSAEAEVFTAFLDTNRIDIDLMSTVPNLAHPTRHYERVTDLVGEIVNARVWGGIHYRESVVKGVDLGRKVAHWTLQRYFLPES